MIKITKIFYFEMAHAISGYEGPCSHIHGHSYVLHVTIRGTNPQDDFIPAPGMIFDFKQLKAIVNSGIIQQLDHKLVLSKDFLAGYMGSINGDNLVVWDMEPTAENMLIFMQRCIKDMLPEGLGLAALKLYETKDSYAEWTADNA
jgi:6-pyruvoyltetrahydropterin/6-carboxytetrahydropterin synthase